jgi:hypothetical protein
MSTRASYTIKTSYSPSTDFYIHHDGYPQGASHYFKLALERCGNPWSFLESFYRANEGAKITKANQHGDTEYHYHISLNKKGQLVVKAYNIPFENTGKVNQSKYLFFKGLMTDFLNKYTN